jgi:hypothetical protein
MNQLLIRDNYHQACKTPSDINEHLEVLYDLAKECSHITEMGVRSVVSTWAFMYRNPSVLVGIDLHVHPNIDEALKVYPNWKFIQADTLKIDIEPTELLFIDTLHIYSQLKKELFKHAKKAKKYIVLHDTTTYGQNDEPTDWQTPEIMENYQTENKKGLIPAIDEFLEANKEWYIYRQYTNNNGLTILKRV